MDQHVVALFYEPGDAARAMEALVEQGVELGEISLFSAEAGAADCRGSFTRDFAAGAAKGGVAGSALAIGGTVVAIGAGGGAIVAVGPLLLVAMAAFGFGATIGGIVAALTRLGVPKPIAIFFDHEVCQSGAVLIGVSTLRHDDGRIAGLLRRHRGANVTATAASAYAA